MYCVILLLGTDFEFKDFQEKNRYSILILFVWQVEIKKKLAKSVPGWTYVSELGAF